MRTHKPTIFLAIIAAITKYIDEYDESYNGSSTKYQPLNQKVFNQNKKSNRWKQYIRPYKLSHYSYYPQNYQQKTIRKSTTQLKLLQLRKWKLYNS